MIQSSLAIQEAGPVTCAMLASYWVQFAGTVTVHLLSFRAQVSLGLCFQRGEGVEPNPGRAVELYRQAAEQNHPTALLGLGICYQSGRGVEQDCSQAIQFFNRAAERGIVAALVNLGHCLFEGLGVRVVNIIPVRRRDPAPN